MVTHPLNLALSLFGLSLLLTACGPSADAKLRNALMGTWTKDDPSWGSISLASNGTFFAQWNTSNRPVKVWTFEGTWTVKGGVCVSTTTKTRSWGTMNRMPEGGTDRKGAGYWGGKALKGAVILGTVFGAAGAVYSTYAGGNDLIAAAQVYSQDVQRDADTATLDLDAVQAAVAVQTMTGDYFVTMAVLTALMQ